MTSLNGWKYFRKKQAEVDEVSRAIVDEPGHQQAAHIIAGYQAFSHENPNISSWSAITGHRTLAPEP